MAQYRMTPARREALRKAQLASAAKRRKTNNRTRIRRRIDRKTVAAVAVGSVALGGVALGGVAGHQLVSHTKENAIAGDPINQLIISRYVEVARYQNYHLNQLGGTARPFDEVAARREALRILRKKKMKKRDLRQPRSR